MLLQAVFATPSADDFCYASELKRSGFIASQVYWYKNWSGRYTSNVLLELLPVRTAFYWVYGLLMFLVTVLTLYVLCKILEYIPFSSLQPRFVIACATLLALYISSRKPVENFYWGSGVFTYQVSFIFALIAVIQLLRNIVNDKMGSTTLQLLIAAVCTLVAVGGNETIGVIMNYLFFCTFILLLIYKRNKLKYLILPFTAGILGFSIGAIAPGTMMRSASYNNAYVHNIFLSTPYAFYSAVVDVTRVLRNPFIIGCMLFFVLLIGRGARATGEKRGIHPYYLAIISFGVLFVTNFTSIFATGETPPARALGLGILVFLIFIHFILKSFYEYLPHDSMFKLEDSMLARVFIILLLIVGILSSHNTQTMMISTITGNTYRYRQEMLKLYNMIAACDPNTPCAIQPPNRQRTSTPVFYWWLSKDPAYWGNKCVAEYYGLQEVKSQ